MYVLSVSKDAANKKMLKPLCKVVGDIEVELGGILGLSTDFKSHQHGGGRVDLVSLSLNLFSVISFR